MRGLQFIREAISSIKSHKIRYCSSKNDNEIKKLRNIGILAHIDAGKTTTTERMLFFSGKLQQMGEVHHGNTVTDYMEQERERGITITSAAVTFPWRNHMFNLIDTPGHIDFTMEVEQTLNVLDGAIVVLDGSAGIEAQTVTVWKQADRYKIPRIIYVNKMDRADADVHMCLDSIEYKLEVPTLCLHLPIKVNNKFIGLVDLLTMEKIYWEATDRGRKLIRNSLSEGDKELWENAMEMRTKLIDKLTDNDDELAEKVIIAESIDNISPENLAKSVYKLTYTQRGVPVVCGSSYKNIGVQTLMDSVILYLPSPEERNRQYKCFEENLCARAFKVIHDKQKGPLVFFRVYSGKLVKGQKIYNTHQDSTEQTGRLLVAYADDFQEVEQVTNGNIAVLTGLKKTITGDLVTNSASTFSSAKKSLIKNKKIKPENENNIDVLFGINRTIPEPVFFCSVEPPSLSYQNALEKALKELQREDPSLRVSYNAETGQTVLAGMGELHLEIIKDRLKKNYKIDVYLGPLQIAYREAPLECAKTEHYYENKIGNTKHSVRVILSVETCEGKQSDILKLDKSQESASNLSKLHPKHLLAVKQGIDVGVNHGPKLGCSVVNCRFVLYFLEVGRGTSETIISAAVTQCIQKLLKETGCKILEPIMQLEIVVEEKYLSSVLADLSRRRAIIQQINIRGRNKVVHSLTPLAELINYSQDLRTITSGTALMNIEFNSYEQMSAMDESIAIRNVTGF